MFLDFINLITSIYFYLSVRFVVIRDNCNFVNIIYQHQIQCICKFDQPNQCIALLGLYQMFLNLQKKIQYVIGKLAIHPFDMFP